MIIQCLEAQDLIVKAWASSNNAGGGASARGSHRISDITTCERKWWLRYVKGLRGRYEPPFRLSGTLIHTCLAWHYAARLPDDAKPEWFHTSSCDEQLERDGVGHPDLIRLAKDTAEAYARWYSADPWTPVAVENEYRARIGDLDPTGLDEPAFDLEMLSPEGESITVQFPALNDEIVTCRTDLVVMGNGYYWAVDHKTQGGNYKSGRLDKWKDDGEYALSWQAMINLLLLRQSGIPVEGFIINRVKRGAPYDFDRHPLMMPPMAYAQASRTARVQVAAERQLMRRIAAGEQPTPRFWSCYDRYGNCDYAPVCGAMSAEEQQQVIAQQFVRISV